MTAFQVEVSIGGLRLRVHGDPGVPLAVGRDFAPFVVEPGEDPAALELHYRDGANLPLFPRGELRFAAGSHFRFFADPAGDGWILDEFTGPDRRCEARIRADCAHVEVRFDSWPAEPQALGSLPRSLETTSVAACARQGLLFVHAVGLKLELHGETVGVLCPASTGSGKSTLSERFSEAETLSDERVALGRRGGEPWIHGTPWRGTAGRVSAGGAPLRALLFLGKHDQAPGIRRLDRSEAFRRLAFHAMTPLWDRTGMERALELADTVSAAVPAGELTYDPAAGDEPVRAAVRAFLKA